MSTRTLHAMHTGAVVSCCSCNAPCYTTVGGVVLTSSVIALVCAASYVAVLELVRWLCMYCYTECCTSSVIVLASWRGILGALVFETFFCVVSYLRLRSCLVSRACLRLLACRDRPGNKQREKLDTVSKHYGFCLDCNCGWFCSKLLQSTPVVQQCMPMA